MSCDQVSSSDQLRRLEAAGRLDPSRRRPPPPPRPLQNRIGAPCGADAALPSLDLTCRACDVHAAMGSHSGERNRVPLRGPVAVVAGLVVSFWVVGYPAATGRGDFDWNAATAAATAYGTLALAL